MYLNLVENEGKLMHQNFAETERRVDTFQFGETGVSYRFIINSKKERVDVLKFSSIMEEELALFEYLV